MFDITDPIFHNEDAARAHLEAIRWPNGPFCPHCGNADPARIKKLQGKSHRKGLHQCNECRGHFSVTVGSVMERSKIPLAKWVAAFHLMASSKKGVSAHQLHRMLGITYKSAWFLAHRVREAMREDTDTTGPIGGVGKTVEADETYFGPKDRVTKRTLKGKPGLASKRAVVALVERGGKVRSFHIDRATKAEVREVLTRNVPRETTLYTDESRLYTEIGTEYAAHETITHSAGEYVRGTVHTNTVENVFSVFKRGMKGIYQHCGEAHLFRYLAEFDFRYNHRAKLGFSDLERATSAIAGAAGKRLTYQQPRQAQIA